MGLLLGIDGNLKILKEAFGPVIGRIVSFAGSVAGKIKEIVLEAALSIAGGAGKTVMGIINKGRLSLKRSSMIPSVLWVIFKGGWSGCRTVWKELFESF